MSRGARCYCVTVFSQEGEDLRLLDPSRWPNVTFAVYQREVCPKTSREHFQLYIEMDSQVRFTTMQETCDGLEYAHFESRKGSQTQAIAYCVKPDVYKGCSSFIEDTSRIEGPFWFGEPKHQGSRQDLLEIKRDLVNGVSLKRVAEEHFTEWVRYNRSFKEFKRIISIPRDFKTIVILFVGPPGLGKSRFAKDLARYLALEGRCDELAHPELPYHYEHNPVIRGISLDSVDPRDWSSLVYKVPDKHSGFWCDDYADQPVFFFDEFDGDRIRPKAFNELADRYECVIPAHGSAGQQMTSKYLVMCSNYLPKYWWKKRSAVQLQQTTRRIEAIIPLIPKTFKNACIYCAEGRNCVFHHP